jgi:cation transporter-like permease
MTSARQIAISALVGAVVWSAWASTADNFSWTTTWLGVGLSAAAQACFELRNRGSSPAVRVSRIVAAATTAAVVGVVLTLAVAAVRIGLDPNETWG